MAALRPRLILPVEIQVRELDSKLLLACVAAERGFESILGYRTDVDLGIAHYAPSVYLSKSMTRRSNRMFRILDLLGHEIAVWDEEALVYPAPEHYYQRRISSEALARVSALFAWGDDNAEMFRKYPEYPGTPIHVTGNPRIDLLRPELRGFFDEDVRSIRERYGRFVLINTNFSKVNVLRYHSGGAGGEEAAGDEPELSPAEIGCKGEFAAAYVAHKRQLYDAFRAMLPALGEAFPEHRFIVRPHPNEKPDPWQAIADASRNIEVVDGGNVIPWLLATDALVHNGCTTAIEAFALDRPAVAYRPLKADRYDHDFPNALSHESIDLGELCGLLAQAIDGKLERVPPPGRPRPFEEYVASLGGPLAADRIVDVLASRADGRSGPPPPLAWNQLWGWFSATKRRLQKQRSKMRQSAHRSSEERHRHRFPGISTDELRARIARFDHSLGRFGQVRAERVADTIFRIYV